MSKEHINKMIFCLYRKKMFSYRSFMAAVLITSPLLLLENFCLAGAITLLLFAGGVYITSRILSMHLKNTIRFQEISIHEAGHCLVSEIVLPGALNRVTLCYDDNGDEHGFIAVGSEDTIKADKDELIYVILSGAVAEEVLLEKPISFHHEDLLVAIRRILEAECGAAEIIHRECILKSVTVDHYYYLKNLIISNKNQIYNLSKVILKERTIKGDNVRDILCINHI